jgi:hypothetical protein
LCNVTLQQTQADERAALDAYVTKLKVENGQLRQRKLEFDTIAQDGGGNGDADADAARRIRFYEEQLRESDETLVATKRAWADTGEMNCE